MRGKDYLVKGEAFDEEWLPGAGDLGVGREEVTNLGR